MAVSNIAIRAYQPEDASAFRSLNEEWITRYFVMEDKDRKNLEDPERTILERGGRILIACDGERRVGCCALLRMSDNEFEVAKMAVTPDYHGKGIGRELLLAAIEEARGLGAERLSLETNRALVPAIRLYESVGFQHRDPSRFIKSPYARSDVQMEMDLGLY